jgi:hypothetical protein
VIFEFLFEFVKEYNDDPIVTEKVYEVKNGARATDAEIINAFFDSKYAVTASVWRDTDGRIYVIHEYGWR